MGMERRAWPPWPRTHHERLHASTRYSACWQGHCAGRGRWLHECRCHRCVSLFLHFSPVSRLGPAEGVLYMWGRNEEGLLGLGDVEDRHTPTVVSLLSGRRVADVVSSNSHTVAVTGACGCVRSRVCDVCASGCGRCLICDGVGWQ
jgi:hypothetical protein